MNDWQIASQLQALHNIALGIGAVAVALGWVAFALTIYPLVRWVRKLQTTMGRPHGESR